MQQLSAGGDIHGASASWFGQEINLIYNVIHLYGIHDGVIMVTEAMLLKSCVYDGEIYNIHWWSEKQGDSKLIKLYSLPRNFKGGIGSLFDPFQCYEVAAILSVMYGGDLL